MPAQAGRFLPPILSWSDMSHDAWQKNNKGLSFLLFVAFVFVLFGTGPVTMFDIVFGSYLFTLNKQMIPSVNETGNSVGASIAAKISQILVD